jgi:glycosyltransferase involved in cell wall biosynthesis
MNSFSSPDFTVVIPTYNRAKFILDTLDSVFAQTYPHYEVIVVDNASTDQTIELLQPLLESGKLRVIRHEQNYERARSRNTGMENARGEYLTLLDSDDFMYPDCLADAAEFARNNPDIKCFHNLYELVDQDRKSIRRYKFKPLKNRLDAITSGNFMSCTGNFLHKEVYGKYRFDTTRDLTGSEDWEFWMRVIADYDVGRIEKYNNGIQQHAERTINNHDIEPMERGLAYLVRKFRQDEHLSDVYRGHLDRIEANCFLYLNLLANDGHLRGRAYQYLRQAFRADASVVLTNRFLRSVRRTLMA